MVDATRLAALAEKVAAEELVGRRKESQNLRVALSSSGILWGQAKVDSLLLVPPERNRRGKCQAAVPSLEPQSTRSLPGEHRRRRTGRTWL